ncbi:MAG: 4Fe-4S binding protein [Clostridiaceae bacterium]
MEKKKNKYLFIITLAFFFLGFFNIIFGVLGFLCMILPIVLLLKDRKKTWCQSYCPRASLFTVLLQGRSLTGKAAPKWLTRGKTKWFVLAYFGMNLFVLTMSTIMVSRGKVEAMEYLRFAIAFRIPWEVPQIINLGDTANWMLHLSYRIYSMMLTTTIIGLVLGWLYIPRTWCTICPINTISDMSLKNAKK